MVAAVATAGGVGVAGAAGVVDGAVATVGVGVGVGVAAVPVVLEEVVGGRSYF